jgi:predicted GNAT family acetyltransferase
MSGARGNPARRRFEMASGNVVAFLECRREGEDRIVLAHTEVPEALSGQGVGSKIVRGVLDALCAQRPKVVPRCEFVAAHVERRPKDWDVLAHGGEWWAAVAELIET